MTENEETYTKAPTKDNYEGDSLGEAGGYTAEGTQKGLKGRGNISNPQALTEGDTLKPQSGESGFSFQDLTGGKGGGGVKESVSNLTGGGGGKGVVDSVKELAQGSGEGNKVSDLTEGEQGKGLKDSVADLTGDGSEGQGVVDSVKDLAGGQ